MWTQERRQPSSRQKRVLRRNSISRHLDHRLLGFKIVRNNFLLFKLPNMLSFVMVAQEKNRVYSHSSFLPDACASFYLIPTNKVIKQDQIRFFRIKNSLLPFSAGKHQGYWINKNYLAWYMNVSEINSNIFL